MLLVVPRSGRRVLDAWWRIVILALHWRVHVMTPIALERAAIGVLRREGWASLTLLDSDWATEVPEGESDMLSWLLAAVPT